MGQVIAPHFPVLLAIYTPSNLQGWRSDERSCTGSTVYRKEHREVRCDQRGRREAHDCRDAGGRVPRVGALRRRRSSYRGAALQRRLPYDCLTRITACIRACSDLPGLPIPHDPVHIAPGIVFNLNSMPHGLEFLDLGRGERILFSK